MLSQGDLKVDDEHTIEWTDKTDDSSSSVETITVPPELTPTEIPDKVNPPEVTEDTTNNYSRKRSSTKSNKENKNPRRSISTNGKRTTLSSDIAWLIILNFMLSIQS